MIIALDIRLEEKKATGLSLIVLVPSHETFFIMESL